MVCDAIAHPCVDAQYAHGVNKGTLATNVAKVEAKEKELAEAKAKAKVMTFAHKRGHIRSDTHTYTHLSLFSCPEMLVLGRAWGPRIVSYEHPSDTLWHERAQEGGASGWLFVLV